MPERIGIIGAGVTGLASAYVLSCTYDVTIVARDLPGDLGQGWASPWAGAVFHPQRHASAIEQQMQRKSFTFYWDLAHKDPSSGVKIYPMTEYLDDRTDDTTIWYKDLMPSYRVLQADELPEGMTLGLKYTALAINPLKFLPWLKEKLEVMGVKFIRKEVGSFEEVRALTNARLIINASGVGARELAGDEEVVPIRGQTMFVKTDFEECLMIEGKDYTYVIPRSDSGGVIIGGIKSDRLDTEVDKSLKPDILRRVNIATGGRFEGLDVNGEKVTDIIGFRPGRKAGIRVEKEEDVVHAYGVGGAGYIFSFGVAERVRELIEGRGFKSKL